MSSWSFSHHWWRMFFLLFFYHFVLNLNWVSFTAIYHLNVEFSRFLSSKFDLLKHFSGLLINLFFSLCSNIFLFISFWIISLSTNFGRKLFCFLFCFDLSFQTHGGKVALLFSEQLYLLRIFFNVVFLL